MDHAKIMQIFFAALCFVTFSDFVLGTDTLYPDQTLADGEKLISPGQIFELGFFSPGKSTTRFLGIWHKTTPDIIVWVANRENPIIGSNGLLALRKNGTLVLSTSQSSIVWSSDLSRLAPSPVLQLLDSGNLVLVEKSTAEENYIWQSFDYPGATRVPGMKIIENPDAGIEKYLTSWRSADDPSPGDFTYRIENQGLSQVVVLKVKTKRYRSGAWNGNYFTGITQFPDPAWKAETAFYNGMLISIADPYNKSFNTRLTMNYSGFIQRYIMNEERDSWSLIFEVPSNPCDYYGRCGYNGICSMYKSPECECLRGFMPKSQKEWAVYDWGSGCTRPAPSNCEKEDEFLKVEGIKLPDPLDFVVNTSMSISECRDKCLKNCNCTAYADRYNSNVSNGCFMWFGDLIDISEFASDSGMAPSMYLRVPISELGRYITVFRQRNLRLLNQGV